MPKASRSVFAVFSEALLVFFFAIPYLLLRNAKLQRIS
jgi:hypothetical protein